MAVLLEFASVIVRKAAIVRREPGGLEAFARRGFPNCLEDAHLVRIGFMGTPTLRESGAE